MGRHYLDKTTQVGKLYALLKRRRGWVDAGEIARTLPTTCVSTVVSDLRFELKRVFYRTKLNFCPAYILEPARRVPYTRKDGTRGIKYQYRLVRG